MRRTIILILALVAGAFSGFSKGVSLLDSYAYTRGVESYNEEKYPEALEWFNKELSEHPDNGYAFFYVAVLRYGYQEYGRALTAINNALTSLPKKEKKWRS